jgi:putative endonuclease
MTTPRQKLGHRGEILAAEYLIEQGYTVIEHNARMPNGEIDLVALAPVKKVPHGWSEHVLDRQTLVFIEVKTRRSTRYGLPEESITPRKKAHLLSAAQSYLQTHPELEGDWRIDVIAILLSGAQQTPEIVQFENVIT